MVKREPPMGNYMSFPLAVYALRNKNRRKVLDHYNV